MRAMGGAGGAARRAAAIVLAAALAGTGCALVRPLLPEPPPPPVEGGVQTGEASWYGPGFHGRRTANGERYDQDALTAAHRTLPFGTRVRVTNLDNGRTVDLRINDRGPFVAGRIIDLSRAGARVIGLIGPGVGPVRLEVLESTAVARAEPPPPARPSPAPLERSPAPVEPSRAYVVEVALLRDASRAERLREVLAGRFPDAPVGAAPVPGDGRYRVLLGPFREEDEAREHVNQVTRLGYPASLVEEER
jgi:peptidoglycan lytic transglycosylase